MYWGILLYYIVINTENSSCALQETNNNYVYFIDIFLKHKKLWVKCKIMGTFGSIWRCIVFKTKIVLGKKIIKKKLHAPSSLTFYLNCVF